MKLCIQGSFTGHGRRALGALDALHELADLDGVLGLPPRQQRRLVDHVRQLRATEPCPIAAATSDMLHGL